MGNDALVVGPGVPIGGLVRRSGLSESQVLRADRVNYFDVSSHTQFNFQSIYSGRLSISEASERWHLNSPRQKRPRIAFRPVIG